MRRLHSSHLRSISTLLHWGPGAKGVALPRPTEAFHAGPDL